MDLRIKDLKNIINQLPDNMLVVIPVIDKNDVNNILGFRKIRTAGILSDSNDPIDSEAFCLNGAANEMDIADQIYFSDRDINVEDILFGKSKYKERRYNYGNK